MLLPPGTTGLHLIAMPIGVGVLRLTITPRTSFGPDALKRRALHHLA